MSSGSCYLTIQVEADPYCREILKARMADGALPHGKIIDNVIGYQPSGPAEDAEFATCGFPCQATDPAFLFYFISFADSKNTNDKYVAKKCVQSLSVFMFNVRQVTDFI